MGRNSIGVRLGRGFQMISPAWRFIDYPFRLPYLFRQGKDLPGLFIVAPPRSGSTLLYQVLTESFHNIHLTNLENLFFSTPMLGTSLSDLLCKKRRTDFVSQHGFVPGICGEAEGLRFWKYWMGQGLVPAESQLKSRKIQKLIRLLSKKYSGNEAVWISGYIGHAFSIEFLRRHWPDAVFVHLSRHLLSNAYSLYTCSSDKWFSLDPGGIRGKADNRCHEVARQIVRIHSIILDQQGSDVLELSYENLCQNPQGLTNELALFASKNNVGLRKKHLLPKTFEKSEISPDLNETTQLLHQYLKMETAKYKGYKKKFFNRLID